MPVFFSNGNWPSEHFFVAWTEFLMEKFLFTLSGFSQGFLWLLLLLKGITAHTHTVPKLTVKETISGEACVASYRMLVFYGLIFNIMLVLTQLNYVLDGLIKIAFELLEDHLEWTLTISLLHIT